MTALSAPVAALAAAGAFVLPGPRGRALAVVAALVLAPVVVAVELVPPARLAMLVEARALTLALVGLAVTGGLAALLVRRPQLLPALAVAALPLRVPLEVSERTVHLLVPLYVVVGAGALAYAWARLAPRAAARPGELSLPAEAARRPTPLELALLFSVLLYAAQAGYSTDPREALRNVAFFYVPFLVLLRLLSDLEWSRRVVARCLAITVSLGVLFALVGVYQYTTGELFWNRKLMAANHFEAFFRVNSLFFDPNIYGRFLVVAMIAACAVLLWGPRRDSRLVALALAVLWVGLCLSFSLSSFAALLIGLAVLGALRFGVRPVALFAAVAVSAVLGAALGWSALGRADLSSVRALKRGASGRIALLRAGAEMFLERPLFGFGSGSFAERYRAREGVRSRRASAASHTTPVTVAAEQGAVGLAAYGLVLAAAFKLLFGGLFPGGRDPPAASLPARAAVAAAFAALVLHTVAYAAFLEDPLTWALMGAGLALSASVAPWALARGRTASHSP